MISSLDHLVLVEIGPVHHAVSHGYESPSPLLDPYGLGESPLSMRHPDSSPIFRVWLSGAVGRVRTLHTHFLVFNTSSHQVHVVDGRLLGPYPYSARGLEKGTNSLG